VRTSIGPNEALILSALCAGSEASVADLAARLESADIGRPVDDGSIYVALQRMTDRGYVASRKVKVVSADGRAREIGRYTITPEGETAVTQFAREAAAVRRLHPILGASG